MYFPFKNYTTYLQNVDMRYTIRGQLLSINNSKLSNDGGIKNGETNDVFGMELLYDQQDSNLGNTAYHNGKLSAVKWMSVDASGTKSYERSYTYAYDNVNRYTGSTYSERTTTGTGSFSNNLNGFDESGITYDAGGNITALNRNSSTQHQLAYADRYTCVHLFIHQPQPIDLGFRWRHKRRLCGWVRHLYLR